MEIESGTFRPAYASIDDYYNKKTRIIALRGPRGVLLAQYLTSHIKPDPRRIQFLTYYNADYTPYEGMAVPGTSQSDVRAICTAVEMTSDARLSVTSGAQDAVVGADTSPTGSDHDIITSGRSLKDANGASFRPHAIDMHVDGTGFMMTGNGIHFKGNIETEKPVKKGVTKESPLFGMLPKSAVTFWVADYLPVIEEIQRIGQFVSQIQRFIDTVKNLSKLLDK